MVLPAREYAEYKRECDERYANVVVMAMEMEDGTIITGRSSRRMVAAAAAILNSIKYLSGMADGIHLISPKYTQEHTGAQDRCAHVGKIQLKLRRDTYGAHHFRGHKPFRGGGAREAHLSQRLQGSLYGHTLRQRRKDSEVAGYRCYERSGVCDEQPVLQLAGSRRIEEKGADMYGQYFVLFAIMFTGWFLRRIDFIDDKMDHSNE